MDASSNSDALKINNVLVATASSQSLAALCIEVGIRHNLEFFAKNLGFE
jgi:hypothetical protein